MASPPDVLVRITLGMGLWAGFEPRVCMCVRVYVCCSPLLRVSHSLPTSEFREEGIETPAANLQKGINMRLFLSYKYRLACCA